MARLLIVLTLLLAGCASRTAERLDSDPPTLVISNVSVVDVETGAIRPAQHVLVRNERIVQIGPSRALHLPAGARVIDGSGGFLIPGLWDMHVHAWDRPLVGPALLGNGITGVREMGSGIGRAQAGHRSPLGWREDLRSGAAPGPRIVAAYAILDGGDSTWYANAPFFKVVRTPEEGRRWVDSLATLGAGFIKVYRSLDREVYDAIVAQARARDIPVEGHVPSAVGAWRAAEAGQRTIEHLTDLLVSISTEEEQLRRSIVDAIATVNTQSAAYQREKELGERLLRTSDDQKLARLAELMSRHGVWQVPTLVVLDDPRLDDPAAEPDPARMRALPPFLQMFVRQYGPLTEEERSLGIRRRARERAVLGALHRAGAPILAGTDLANPWVYPGFSLHDELALLVNAGLSPLEALRAATLNPARYLGGTDSLGTVRVGRLADLVLLDANPLDDIGNTRRIRAVVMNGRAFERAALDSMLTPARP